MEWIDVNYLLPENDTNVIGRCDDDVFECHHYDDGAFDTLTLEAVKVEYWQPLPDSPYQTGQISQK